MRSALVRYEMDEARSQREDSHFQPSPILQLILVSTGKLPLVRTDLLPTSSQSHLEVSHRLGQFSDSGRIRLRWRSIVVGVSIVFVSILRESVCETESRRVGFGFG